MTVYRCWDVLNGDEDDARKVESSSPAFAAETFAEKRDQRDCEYPNESTVRVRTPNGDLFEFAVTLRSEPVYTADTGKCIEQARRSG